MRATILLVYFIGAVCANTEITNFQVPEASVNTLRDLNTTLGPVLNYPQNEYEFQVVPLKNAPAACKEEIPPVSAGHRSPICAHQVWVTCDLNASKWAMFQAFTLRLSWPASQPARFDIDIFDDVQLFHHPANSRVRYARITAMSAGVKTPHAPAQSEDLVSFNLIVEPLYFGAVPLSVIPLTWLVIPSLGAAYIMSRRVNVFLYSIQNKGSHGRKIRRD